MKKSHMMLLGLAGAVGLGLWFSVGAQNKSYSPNLGIPNVKDLTVVGPGPDRTWGIAFTYTSPVNQQVATLAGNVVNLDGSDYKSATPPTDAQVTFSIAHNLQAAGLV
jgi:hypothetical protein